MGRIWDSILAQYGQDVTLQRKDGTVQARAFFQPVDEKAPGVNPTALGVAPAGKYLYLGPPDVQLTGVTELLLDEQAFRIIRHREYRIGDEMVYRWAVCEEADL